jgi:hypothetical protein
MGQSSLVAAMGMSRQDATARTCSRSHARTRLDHHRAGFAADLIDGNATLMRRQNFTIPP